jgi:UDP-glucose 4-epimerase
MTTLVTGGAGFIGSNIVERLVQEGETVTILDNLSSGHRANIEGFRQVRFVQGDVRDSCALAEAIKGAETVFHLAASVGNKRSLDNPIEDAEVNVLGTLRVLEAARRAGSRKVVFSSSAGIFGELKTLPIREDHPCEPDTPYGASKLGAEKECLAYSKQFSLEVVSLRYFNVYGPRQRFDAYGNVIPIFVFKMLGGEPLTIFGDGEQTRDFVHVRDVVQANLKAARASGLSGAFNVASGDRITINKLVELLCNASEIKPVVEHAPVRPGDVRHSIADISAARKAFGFEPMVSLVEGLGDYVRWARTSLA